MQRLEVEQGSTRRHEATKLPVGLVVIVIGATISTAFVTKSFVRSLPSHNPDVPLQTARDQDDDSRPQFDFQEIAADKILQPIIRAPSSKMISQAWQNLSIQAILREPARATFFPFERADMAIAAPWPCVASAISSFQVPADAGPCFEREAAMWGDVVSDRTVEHSSRFLGLHGNWMFKWISRAVDRVDPTSEGISDLSWFIQRVPSNWQLHGFGYPMYVSSRYPFANNPPFIRGPKGSDNPVGTYKRHFDLPESWDALLKDGWQVFVHFEGVSSAAYVWVNNHFAGFSKQSKVPCEFRITAHVAQRRRTHTIVVEVMQWSDGSFLEDHGSWQLSGIEREVYLLIRPPWTLWDVMLYPTVDKENGNLVAYLKVRHFGDKVPEKGATVRLSVYSRSEHSTVDVIATATGIVSPESVEASDIGEVQWMARLHVTIPNVQLWSPDSPNLYRVVASLEAGPVQEHAGVWTGFRTIKVHNNQLTLNGRQFVIRGLNRNEHSERTGHVIGWRAMLFEIMRLKQLNANAVRTAHFPHHPYFYELADRFGIAVVDEANIGSHASGFDSDQTLANKPEWAAAHIDRTTAMFERDKNHPCVVMWSLGNAAGNGDNLMATYNWLKRRDPSRPVLYSMAGGVMHHDGANTDVLCPSYPSPSRLLSYANSSRPVVMLEYSHSMGNSGGALQAYWKLIRSNPVLHGGFVWSLSDQGLIKRAANGRDMHGYGGDFGPKDAPSDGNFCIAGVLAGDRSFHPTAWEVKKMHEQISTVADLPTRTVLISNHFFELNLAGIVVLDWRVLHRGIEIESGSLTPINVGPGEALNVSLPFTLPQLASDSHEYVLEVQYRLTSAAASYPSLGLLHENFEIAWTQFPFSEYSNVQWRLAGSLGNGPPSPVYPAPMLYEKTPGVGVTATEHQDEITVQYSLVTGRLATFSFQKQCACLASITVGGTQLVISPLRPNYWRAPTDQDYARDTPNRMRVWRDATTSDAQRPRYLRVKREANGRITVETSVELLAARQELGRRGALDEDTMVIAIQNTTFSFGGEQGGVGVVTSFSPEPGVHVPLPRAGLGVVLNGGFTMATYYGKGPHENYWDRKASARVGVYELIIANVTEAYVRPQENGNRCDVRWLSLNDPKRNITLFLSTIETSQLLAFSTHHHFPEEFDDGPTKRSSHFDNLQRANATALNLDLAQMGVGGINSWGAEPLQEFTIPCRPWSFGFWLAIAG